MKRKPEIAHALELFAAVWIAIAPVEAQFTQQGVKLTASDAIGMSQQRLAVAISADGNTALVGGYGDNNNIGAAWVYTRSAGRWNGQAKLVGSGVVGSYAFQGIQCHCRRTETPRWLAARVIHKALEQHGSSPVMGPPGLKRLS